MAICRQFRTGRAWNAACGGQVADASGSWLMDFTGLTKKFPNNRPLSDFEREHRLLQKKRLDVPLLAQLCVVTMNSRTLVSVDRWYAYRGYIALLGLIGVAFAVGGIAMLAWILLIDKAPNENGIWEAIFFGIVMFAGLGVAGAWVARKELFRWTYYPIVLDRKTRQVHVFRLDGTVLSAPWDTIYFTLGRGTGPVGAFNWDIRGLILAEDGVTVKETFAFCITTGEIEHAHSHWEFLRRYMQEGPAAVREAVLYCMPLERRPESFAVGKERIFANDAHAPAFMYLTMIPFNYVHALARWLVMRTSKVPVFPPAIEAARRPEPDDPYVFDASMNPEDLR
ncbi:DUF6708 domain-containing protein [Stenotrophomonas sp. 24(2023)]|uniref:DUF6708 domain-containing protein n=1 Tax=Stenotrophomonas sp. 24(2023) TaxID=3068324 RepID=UPI0027E134FC|nr:DUF6708 domain-containing protein [Stenotrophomonas sp. 24(2023)]WMJ68076.1 hypothetical protein Q9R17_12800 [Stenotrophomonas sp. 24(2023)]